MFNTRKMYKTEITIVDSQCLEVGKKYVYYTRIVSTLIQIGTYEVSSIDNTVVTFKDQSVKHRMRYGDTWGLRIYQE